MPYVLDFIRPGAERDLAAIGRAMASAVRTVTKRRRWPRSTRFGG